MVSSLDRKLLRDLSRTKGQVVAIAVVIACGVAMLVMCLTTLKSLENSQLTYYDRYRFAEVFALLKRAPESLKDRIQEVEGVARVQTRVVEGVVLDIEGMSEPAVGRLISIPETGEPVLNSLHLRSGRWVEVGRPGEVIVNEVFAENHGFKPGDKLRAVLNGSMEELRIVGIAMSPEYIIQMPEAALLPDDKRFGVFWMGRDQLEAAFNMESAFNDVTLTLLPGASEDEVIRRLDGLLERYGGVGAIGRHNQISNRFVSEEIQQLSAMAFILPTIFLGVAAFLLNIVLKRLIALEREQIAVLKAFGYSHWDVGWHYLKFVSVIALGGVALGTLLGIWFGRGMTAMYTEFYRFPVFGFDLDLGVIVIGAVVSLGAAFLGVFGAIRGAINLPPAEAMRPEPPANYNATLVDRLGLRKLLSQEARIVLRELGRKPGKAFFTSLGIAMSLAILVVGNYSQDAINYLQDFQFRLAERQDLTVSFFESVTGNAVNHLTSVDGVIAAEEFRSVPVRLRSGHLSKEVGIQGLVPKPELFRLMDADENVIPVPDEGLLLSAKLGELLQVSVGDVLTVEVLEDKRPIRQLTVTGLVNDFAGTAAYMERRALNAFMREGSRISGAYLKIDKKLTDEIYRELKETPMVASVSIKDAAMKSFQETFAENLLRMKLFNIGFACAIAVGVVYNSARISLSERSRDLGTLRVIGFTRGEISGILLGELGVVTAAAIPLGMGIGTGLVYLMSKGLETELYRIPFVVNPQTYAVAALVIMAASLICGLIVRRKLDKLDLVEVLKARI